MPISGYELARQPIPLDHLRRQVEREKAEVEELGRRRSRRAAGGSPGGLTGYPAVYGVETEIAGLFREILAPGAFRGALSRPDDVRLLRDHDKSLLLARTTNATLHLAEDVVGLRMRAVLPDTELARETLELVRLGTLSQGSFAFVPRTVRWYPPDKRDGLPLAVVEDAGTLYDVSSVTYPAYESTTMHVGRTDEVAAWERRLRLTELRLERGPGSPLPPETVRRFLAERPGKAWARDFVLRAA